MGGCHKLTQSITKAEYFNEGTGIQGQFKDQYPTCFDLFPGST